MRPVWVYCVHAKVVSSFRHASRREECDPNLTGVDADPEFQLLVLFVRHDESGHAVQEVPGGRSNHSSVTVTVADGQTGHQHVGIADSLHLNVCANVKKGRHMPLSKDKVAGPTWIPEKAHVPCTGAAKNQSKPQTDSRAISSIISH